MGATGLNIISEIEKRERDRMVDWREIFPLVLSRIGLEDAREPMCDGDIWA